MSMSTTSTRIEPGPNAVATGLTRTRQTATPATPFKDVLAGGANALLAGVEAAGGAIGGPVVAAAIRQTRTSASSDLVSNAPGVPGAEQVSQAPTQGSELDALHQMNLQSQAFNLELLKLQEEVQTENRRFTTLSNVVRARHDTAKSAVSNVRS